MEGTRKCPVCGKPSEDIKSFLRCALEEQAERMVLDEEKIRLLCENILMPYTPIYVGESPSSIVAKAIVNAQKEKMDGQAKREDCCKSKNYL